MNVSSFGAAMLVMLDICILHVIRCGKSLLKDAFLWISSKIHIQEGRDRKGCCVIKLTPGKWKNTHLDR